LLYYTDVHAINQWDAPKAMQQAVGMINMQRADLIINGGDLIHGGFDLSKQAADARWDAYLAMHDAIEGEIFSTLGNHDLVAVNPSDGSAPSADPRDSFRKRLGLVRTYYSFDALGYHFVVLDSVKTNIRQNHYAGAIEPEQIEWLREDLSKIPTGRPIVAVTHIPLLTSLHAATRGATEAAPEYMVVVNNVEVMETFATHNLILVLQGHLHVNELIRWRNTTFITGGAICGAWWRGPRLGTEEGFGVVTLDGGRVSWEYIDYGWKAGRRRRQKTA
jgi:3',5'-cyclic AMP phosphodiesterase CpdA